MAEITIESIMADIATAHQQLKEQEVTSCNNFINLQQEQEVYKDKNNKRTNNTSCDQDLQEGMTTTSSPFGEDTGGEVNSSARATTTSCSQVITGVSVQHCRTETGIKVACNIQTATDAETGDCVALTAELKRSHRMNQIKKLYEPDRYEFQQLYWQTLEQLRELPVKQRKSICVGRLHQRGQRAAWVADMFMIAYMNEDRVESVYLNANNQEIEIELDGILSPTQTEMYWSTGIYGQLRTGKPAPTLATLKRIRL
jgi:hypothetical protein